MKSQEHIFTYSREECVVHRFEDFPYPLGATVGDFVQTTDPVIKQSCCI